MNKSLAIPEWHQMALEGKAPPVRITLNGNSMFPLIRWGKDYVTIVPLDRELMLGDIVLIAELNTGRYVMHRVWEIRENQIRTWGDNCWEPDPWVPTDAIWGRAILIEHGRREIKTDPRKGLRWAKFWRHAGKPYRLIKSYWNAIIRRIKKLFT